MIPFIPHTNYITKEPQVTFFKSVYRRHTPFIVVNIEVLGTTNTTNTTIITVPNDDNMHLLNTITIVHDDPLLVKHIEYIEIRIGGVMIDRIDQIENDPFNKTINQYDDIRGGILRPWFWFNEQGGSYPLCASKLSPVEMIINWKKETQPNLRFYVSGFVLADQELARFKNVSHEYLIETRQPIHSSSTFNVIDSDKTILWNPQRHHLFGKDFTDSVFTLLCCLRRTFGIIDKNIRQLIIKEWAKQQGAQIRNFCINLKEMTNPTKTFHISLFDSKRQFNGRIYKAMLYEKKCGVCICENPGQFMPNNIWSFALKPDEHQPSGHVINLTNHILIVHCDARVQSVIVQSRGYSILRIGTGITEIVKITESGEENDFAAFIPE